MAENSKIEWTDATWNAVIGCERISPGCAHCYAKAGHDMRHKGHLNGKKMLPMYAQPFEVIQLQDHKLDLPLRWRTPRRIFVNSTSDLFHEDVPDSFIDKVFAVMACAPHHTFQVLTKRAERMRSYFESFKAPSAFQRAWNICAWVREDLGRPDSDLDAIESIQRGLSNVWLGVSVENQRFADERIPLLLQTPAAVRFVSYEPALGPVDFRRWLRCNDAVREHGSTGKVVIRQRDGIDWIIVGGESGHGARPFELQWARSVIGQCGATMGGCRAFVKQLGSRACDVARPANVTDAERAQWQRDGWCRVITHEGEFWTKHPRLRDKKGGDMQEWPKSLRVRQFPEVRV